MRSLMILLAMLMLAPPSPKLCREFGVDVPDGAEVTGEIIRYEIVPPSEITGKCQGYRSCAIPVIDNLWEIYTIDDTGVRVHEECHALYQERNHTTDSERPRT